VQSGCVDLDYIDASQQIHTPKSIIPSTFLQILNYFRTSKKIDFKFHKFHIFRDLVILVVWGHFIFQNSSRFTELFYNSIILNKSILKLFKYAKYYNIQQHNKFLSFIRNTLVSWEFPNIEELEKFFILWKQKLNTHQYHLPCKRHWNSIRTLALYICL
jgi:hypothetical protein